MSIKAVTVDFWNTLFDSSGGVERNKLRQQALIEQIRSFEIEFDPQKYNDAMKASWEYFNKIWKNDFRTPGGRETIEFFWKFMELPEDEQKLEIVVQKFADSVLVNPPKPLPGAREALELLGTNYDLALISDTGFSPGQTLMELLRREGLDVYFKAFSFSDENGVSKPHPKAYGTALNKIGRRPEEAVHIGDIEFTDVAGAKKIGMKAIRFIGDPTGMYTHDKNEKTIADAVVESWAKMPQTVETLNLKSANQ